VRLLGRSDHTLWRALVAVSWVMAGGLVLAAIVRLGQWDDTAAEVAVIAVTPLLYLPAYPILVLAVADGAWAQAAVALVLVACHLVWVVPEMRPALSASTPPAGAVGVRLFSANIDEANPNLAGIAREIGDRRPDVVMLFELTPAHLAALDATHVLDRYASRVVYPVDGAGGLGVWSALPSEGLEVWWAGSHAEVRGWLRAGGTRVRFYAVHTDAPTGAHGPARWKAELAVIASQLRAEPHPLLVAGDFNATWDLAPFQSILHLGLRDAAVVRGEGWVMTWPRDLPFVPPFLRIDHVLVSPDLVVTGFTSGRGTGSDHRPVVVDLAVPAHVQAPAARASPG
jgi:endonuclease/exonuclease/phosphatase (EEP) superfamily protein YafD